MEKIYIDLNVRDKKYFVSKYNDEVIDPELSTYITNYMIGNDIRKKVVINIKSKFELTEIEKEKYSKIIRKEFSENIDELNEESRKSNERKSLILLLGIVFIMLSYLIDSSLGHIFSQVLTVFGWVALWEVAYALLFGDAKRRRTLMRYNQLFNCDIVFENNEGK